MLGEADATVGEDYEFQNLTSFSRVLNFTLPGSGKRSFDLITIDDNIAETHTEVVKLIVGVYSSTGVDQCASLSINIEDNEGIKSVHSL